jgi:E3 ubiquitin-protein ligase UBR4
MAAAAEISAMLNHLAASAERDPPARRLRSPTARPGLEALAGALAAGPPTDPAAARAVLSAARAVVSAVLPTLGELLRSRLSRLGWSPWAMSVRVVS